MKAAPGRVRSLGEQGPASRSSSSSRAAKKGKVANVKVVVRIRPLLKSEDTQCCLEVNQVGTKKTVAQLSLRSPVLEQLDRHAFEEYKYEFDRCYSESTRQKTLFDREVANHINCVFKGINSTVFAYGATGTGKTFTIQGTKKNPGIVHRAVKQLFAQMKAESGASSDGELGPGQKKCSLRMSFVELYNNRLIDLLTRKVDVKDLAIREKNGVIFVPDLSEVSVSSVEEFSRLYDKGCSNRKTATTLLNEESSRSHSMLVLKVLVSDAAARRSTEAKLNIIDLAGSEDNRRTGNTGRRLVESGNINMSLFVLGKVINALNSGGKERVPYRDSKLTRLLQDSLGGTSNALMICNITPGANMFQETYQTLNYASKAKQIVNCLDNSKNVKVRPRSAEDLSTVASRNRNSSEDLKKRLERWQNKKQMNTQNKSHGGDKQTSTTFGQNNNREVRNNNTNSNNSGASDSSGKAREDARGLHASQPSRKRSHPLAQGRDTTEKVQGVFMGQAKGLHGAATRVPLGDKTNTLKRDSLDNLTKEKDQEDGKAVSPETLKKARDLIVIAKKKQEDNKLSSALKLFREALELLPGHTSLQQRVAELEEEIQQRPCKRKSSLPKVAKETELSEPIGDIEYLACLTELPEDAKREVAQKLIDMLNSSTKRELLQLHGVGEKRADLIVASRSTLTFHQLHDLHRIGLTQKQVVSMARLNALLLHGPLRS